MDKILYKLDTFEGPLDLLLTLIQKNKVSIYDIPIVEITAQYLEAIDGIEEANLDNTSEFLVMASNLLYIKSKMLLPKNEEEEDEEDPREELARRLAEYQHDTKELIDAFNNIFQRRLRKAKPEKRAFSKIVGREKVSVDDMVEKICKVLKHNKRVQFESLFKADDSRPEMIATFLAVLEMIKLNKLYADYDEKSDDFILTTEKKNG